MKDHRLVKEQISIIKGSKVHGKRWNTKGRKAQNYTFFSLSFFFLKKVGMFPSFPLKPILRLVVGTYRKLIDNLMRPQKKKTNAYYCHKYCNAKFIRLGRLQSHRFSTFQFLTRAIIKFPCINVAASIRIPLRKHEQAYLEQISYNLPFNITKNTLQYLMSLK